MTDKTPSNSMKFAYAYVIIMIAINFLYVGYVVSAGVNPSTVTEDEIYNFIVTGASQPNSQVNTLSNLTKTYGNESTLINTGSTSSSILDILDQIWNFASKVGFIIGFIALGGGVASIFIQDFIANNILAFLVRLILIIGNFVFVYLVTKDLMNKFKFGG